MVEPAEVTLCKGSLTPDFQCGTCDICKAEIAGGIALKYYARGQYCWRIFKNTHDAVGSAFWMDYDDMGSAEEIVSLYGSLLLNPKDLQDEVYVYERSIPKVNLPEAYSIPEADIEAATAFSKFMGNNFFSPDDWLSLPEHFRDHWRGRVKTLDSDQIGKPIGKTHNVPK